MNKSLEVVLILDQCLPSGMDLESNRYSNTYLTNPVSLNNQGGTTIVVKRLEARRMEY